MRPYFKYLVGLITKERGKITFSYKEAFLSAKSEIFLIAGVAFYEYVDYIRRGKKSTVFETSQRLRDLEIDLKQRIST